MRVVQFLPLIIVLASAHGQEEEISYTGADYFRFKPGAQWQMIILGGDGGEAGRTTFAEPSAATKDKIGVLSQTKISGIIGGKTVQIFALGEDGTVLLKSWASEIGTSGQIINQEFDPPQIYLPAKLKIGTKWSFEEPTGDIHNCEITDRILVFDLPNGQTFIEVLEVRVVLQSGSTGITLHKYLAPDYGIIGTKMPNGRWYEYLAKDK